jgi:hypothetical protein
MMLLVTRLASWPNAERHASRIDNDRPCADDLSPHYHASLVGACLPVPMPLAVWTPDWRGSVPVCAMSHMHLSSAPVQTLTDRHSCKADMDKCIKKERKKGKERDDLRSEVDHLIGCCAAPCTLPAPHAPVAIAVAAAAAVP